MKQAKSIYLGGEIVSADDCDYQSYKFLGLICPYCSEAVFLRSGSIRETTLRNKKQSTQIVQPSFAHYKGSLTSMECENRATTKEGRERIKAIIIESRNQRLELFNKRLWDLIKSDRNIREKKISNIVKSFIDNRELQVLALQTRRYWAEILPRIYEIFDSMREVNDFTASHSLMGSPLKTAEDMAEEKAAFEGYFGTVSKQFHYTVCTEVADFLTTHTSGHAFYWLTRAAIYQMVCLGQKDSTRDPYYICLSIASVIFGTHWLTIIQREFNPD
jgi:hypothetical protein